MLINLWNDGTEGSYCEDVAGFVINGNPHFGAQFRWVPNSCANTIVYDGPGTSAK